ncbi:tetratricopeptide repeat protein [Ornithinibacillus halotolerans]|uniref:TPR repeat-containing protein YsoA n=1 Tax=Ornithinibacillus halotolerans TaxID=1274357 RepID=A0A916S8K0_9BACI|nr:tetratricopeptide repeat protein [Ornithinibacillus halotolerans]GGA86082.1 TPR repeat-containing protein YsoA [Ornithinibacillus halotolerans]
MDENIIMFPRWESNLKEESFYHIQEKQYEEALEKLNKLLQFSKNDHEILIGKLMCLMELYRYQEAEELCEEIISDKNNKHYYHYLHMYFTILFQTNKYELLMERLEDELHSKGLPELLREQFLQLYNMSKTMVTEIDDKKSSMYVDELLAAIQQSNYDKQWQSIMNLQTVMKELDERIIPVLNEAEVHPVIKTELLFILANHNYSKMVNVHKFGQELQVIPINLSKIQTHPTYVAVINIIKDVEQSNPTLYNFLERLLYRYLYVLFPIIPPFDNAGDIARSLLRIGDELFQQTTNALSNHAKVDQYLNDILNCEQLYLSIIHE